MKEHTSQTGSNNERRRLALLALFVALFLGWASAGVAQTSPPGGTTVDYALFKDPPPEFRGHAWFTFNLGSLTDASVTSMVDRAAQSDSYGGFMITSSGGRGGGRGGAPTNNPPTTPAATYLSEEFFRFYRLAIEEGLKYKFPMDVLYDEQQFPSGMAGGLFRTQYPDLIGKSLDLAEKDVKGPAQVEVAAPITNGVYIGAVRMNLDTLECVDISNRKTADKTAIKCSVPKGTWKVMLFYLDASANRRGLVDYLDPKAVDALINIMYQKYYDHLKDYFGSVIKMTFYDEPGMQHPEFKGRLWTPGYNEAFQKKFGYSPMKYYPALWYDIGPETAAARNALFGFRSEMYAENFIGRIAAWDAAHDVKMSGHLDQEEAPNPVSVQGDLMKVFKRQDIPGIDDIWFTGRANVSYKIVTSSAFNWDKPVVMTETFAAYRPNWANVTNAYRTTMDQHAMGTSLQIGNRPGNTPEMGRYVGRLEYLLRHGRHVADIAVLYPIAALQSAFRFAAPPRVSTRNADPNFYYALEGGIVPPEIDYMQLGEMLFRGYKIDYTYLHPEILETRCIIEGNKLIIDNKENREEFRVLIIPGGDTINLAVAKKIQEFYNAGGAVIATSKLPTRSAEFGKDKEVQQIMDEVFGLPLRGPITADIRSNTDEFKIWWSHPNKAGGKAFFLPKIDTTMMTDALNQCDPVRDVDVQMPPTWPVKMLQAYDGALTYIHKVKDGRDIYFFANSTDAPVDTKVVLRGNKNLAIWNPHTGEQEKAEIAVSESAGQPVTTVHLVLQPVTSVFYVQE
ncbi:MAG: glycosyl hydrolase [Verrucomicrobiia bacterium]